MNIFTSSACRNINEWHGWIFTLLYIFHLAFQGSEENRVCAVLTEQQMKAPIPLWSVILTKLYSVSTLSSGLQGSDAHVPRLSFSAALTRPMRRVGTIEFNEVFVNENNAYDPKTGVFYFLSTQFITLKTQVQRLCLIDFKNGQKHGEPVIPKLIIHSNL